MAADVTVLKLIDPTQDTCHFCAGLVPDHCEIPYQACQMHFDECKANIEAVGVEAKEVTPITESQLWQWMREGQYPPLIDKIGLYNAHKRGVYGLNRRAHATLDTDVGELLKGTRVNIVMASRLGDVGITTDLEAENGYMYRLTCVESVFMGEEHKPTGILTEITPIEDDPDKVKKAFPDGAPDIRSYKPYV